MAMRAKAFEHEVHALHLESFWQCNGRNPRGKAIRAMASGTVEMDMHIVDRTAVRIPAKLVFEHPVAILERMDDMMFQKQAQGTEQGRFVHSSETCFQLGKRNRVLLLAQCFQDQQTDSCRLDPLLFQKFFDPQHSIFIYPISTQFKIQAVPLGIVFPQIEKTLKIIFS